jgi:hypothetical protein
VLRGRTKGCCAALLHACAAPDRVRSGRAKLCSRALRSFEWRRGRRTEELRRAAARLDNVSRPVAAAARAGARRRGRRNVTGAKAERQAAAADELEGEGSSSRKKRERESGAKRCSDSGSVPGAACAVRRALSGPCALPSLSLSRRRSPDRRTDRRRPREGMVQLLRGLRSVRDG